jgi:hypothetical protein
MDCCKLCYQERESKDHLQCKRAHLAAYNSLLAILRLEKGKEFEDAWKTLEEAKTKCLATVKPDNQCHTKSQEALGQTLAIYDKILENYKRIIPMRSAPRL